jgi:hypothetical protein
MSSDPDLDWLDINQRLDTNQQPEQFVQRHLAAGPGMSPIAKNLRFVQLRHALKRYPCKLNVCIDYDNPEPESTRCMLKTRALTC